MPEASDQCTWILRKMQGNSNIGRVTDDAVPDKAETPLSIMVDINAKQVTFRARKLSEQPRIFSSYGTHFVLRHGVPLFLY